jgi:hypothetical protein
MFKCVLLLSRCQDLQSGYLVAIRPSRLTPGPASGSTQVGAPLGSFKESGMEVFVTYQIPNNVPLIAENESDVSWNLIIERGTKTQFVEAALLE